MNHIQSSIRVLSDSEMELIHKYSLKILWEIGIQTPNDEMCALLKSAGCKINEPSQVVHYPPTLIEEMVQEWRNGYKHEEYIELKPQHAGISTEIFLIDYMTGTRRPGVMDDIRKGIALLDKMDSFTGADAIVVPSDVPGDMSDLMTFREMYTYSRKQGGTYILNVQAAPFIIQMANRLKRKVGFLLDTVSPLKIRKESLDTALIFRKYDMPLSFCPMVTAMGSAPVTAAGSIAVQNAEFLCGSFMLRCLGVDTHGYPGMVHPCDPATLMCSFGSSFIARTSVACAQMARFYGLTPGGNIALTDALMPDFQSGFEKAFSFMLGTCSGLRSIGAQGIVGADQGNSYEQIVIDNEWIKSYNHLIHGIDVSEETIGYEDILEIGRNGGHLNTDLTLDSFRDEIFSSKLFSCAPWDLERSRIPLVQRAHSQAEEITKGYRDMDPVLSASEVNDIQRIADEGRDWIIRHR